MEIFNYLFILGLFVTGLSYRVLLGSFVKHFTDLRIFIPRLFNEYKQEELSDNLAKLDKSLVKTAKLIFFSGFFVAIGVVISYIGLLYD